jgi:hypothetical protein
VLGFLLSVLLFTLVVAVLCAAVAGLTVVPFVVALGMAERRGFSATRWGVVSLGGAALALAVGVALHRSDAPVALTALLVPITWVAPGVLWLLDGTEQGLGGRRGAHEQ